MLRDTTPAPVRSVVIATLVILTVQAALAFHKYRFNNGLVLGTTLAIVTWYEDAARRKGLPISRVGLVAIATSAAALTLILQHQLSVTT
jgi:hypothetical protein